MIKIKKIKSEQKSQTPDQIIQIKNNQHNILIREFHGTLRPYQNTSAGANGHIVLVPVQMPPITSSKEGVIEVTLPWQCDTFTLTGYSDNPAMGPIITFQEK